MSLEEDCKLCCAHDKRRHIEEGSKYWKSTERPRILLVLVWCSVILPFVGLCTKIVYLSSQVEEQKLKLEINQNLMKELFQWRDRLGNNFEWTKQQQDDGKYYGHENTLPRNVSKIRSKRSPLRTRRRARFLGPCHLEGRSGPNIISYEGVPRQRPRTASECLLWKRPDNEPPAYCLMKTREDQDSIGVQYIKIEKTGFYYVYAQLTYESHTRIVSTGFRVERDMGGTGTVDVLLTATAPPNGISGNLRRGIQESQYTGGVFRLDEGDLLAVYPQHSASQFIMSQSRSFFGAHYVGRYDM